MHLCINKQSCQVQANMKRIPQKLASRELPNRELTFNKNWNYDKQIQCQKSQIPRQSQAKATHSVMMKMSMAN